MKEAQEIGTPYPKLSRPPIQEAVIDIRVKLNKEFDVKQFLKIRSYIQNDYPKSHNRYKWEGQFEVKGEETNVFSTPTTLIGYFFTSGDGKTIFQARTDGFTFNKLKPYQDWEIFRDEAKRLWGLYSELVSPEIVRVALRFINRLDIPLTPERPIDVKEYLTIVPDLPKTLPQYVTGFLTRFVLHDSSDDSSAIITQRFEQVLPPEAIALFLDIDVFKQKELFEEFEAWKTIEKLRLLKNKIFFASLTRKALELLK